MTEPHLEHSIFGGQHDDQAQHQRSVGDEVPLSRVQRRAAAKPRRRGGRRLGCLFIAIVLVAAAAFAAYTVLRPVVDGLLESNDYPGPGSGEVQVVVNDGDTGRAIGTTLEKAGVVKTAKAFLEAASADARSASIQPGTYTLKKQMTAKDALAVLVDTANRSVPRVTIREGLWKSEIFAALSKGTGVPVAEYAAAAKDPQALGLPASAKGNLEGYLFPSTYEFPEKSTAAEQLKTMVAKTVSELEKAGVAEADMERTLIVASIVEGEVSGDADRAKVARVIENRIKTVAAPNYGLLQMDSTVHFAVQKRGRAGTSDADRNSSSPYNTYKVQGLPPGPINSPGAASIAAAASPADGSWLFFVTTDPDTGETKFATTTAEHQRNVQEFQAWCREHERPVLNAAVLGRPVAHSLSPALHAAGYRATGLTEWSYAVHEVGEDELAGFVAGLDDSWRGLSLTMPLKEAAFAVATTVSRTARATGAINTLVRRDDLGWDGHNTDVRGIEAALAEVTHDGAATVLGGGATARSALLALSSLGVERVALAVRGDARPETLRLAVHAGVAVEVVPLASWAASAAHRLIVSTLPPDGAAAAVASLAGYRMHGTLMDVVYADWPTPLATAAAAAGLDVLSGLDMLVYQAAEQFRLFTGTTPPVQAMYAAGRQALGR